MRAKLGLADEPPTTARWSTTCSRCCARTASTTPRSSGRCRRLAARRRHAGSRRSSPTRRAFDAWTERWRARLRRGRPARRSPRRWTAVNPVYIPRNHLVEEALAAATAGDLGPFDRAARRARPAVRGAPRPRALRRAGARRASARTARSAAPDRGHRQRARRRRGGATPHVRDHLAPGRGQDDAHREAAAVRRAVAEAGSVTAPPGRRAATSDWMELERRRGISVTSTVLRFEHDESSSTCSTRPGTRTSPRTRCGCWRRSTRP